MALPIYELDHAMAVKAGLAIGSGKANAANSLAGTKGLEMVGALNVLAGNGKTHFRELAGVLNQLAGTVGLEAQAAASRWAGR